MYNWGSLWKENRNICLIIKLLVWSIIVIGIGAIKLLPPNFIIKFHSTPHLLNCDGNMTL